MIKYVEFDSIDETGQHITPVNSLYQMNKIASGAYSPEIMKVIYGMKKNPNRYDVVINALGSYEVWGNNRNGDAFPESGLTHLSLRTDMGTAEDYGFKTFEYYAKWFRNHVNKPTSPNFGEVIYSHWNPIIHRVELIVGIDVAKDSETVQALENGELVSVSMGCRVAFDTCSICGNNAKTRKEYCIHAQNHLGEIVTEEMARKWSAQTGKKILPGMQVFVWNWKPRFFDISKVFIGADRTSYVLGKAANKKTKATSSLNLAEAYGITDSMIDKAATVKKQGEIDKVIGDPPDDMNGVVTKPGSSIITPSVNEKIDKTIAAEPILPKNFLDGIASTRSLPSIFSTMLGMGIFPKPVEVQRIVLVHIGQKPIADALDKNNEVFDYNSDTEPLQIPDNFDDSLSRILAPFLAERSSCPHFMLPRMEYIDKQSSLNKYAFYSSTMGNDYWIDPDPKIGLPKRSIISPAAGALAGVAAIYAGLKAKSMGIGSNEMANIFVNKPWLAALIGGGVMYGIYQAMLKNQSLEAMPPASAYEGALQNTNFTGHIKAGADVKSFQGASRIGRGILAAGIAFPAAYYANAVNQKSMAEKGYPEYPALQNVTPTKAAIGVGAATTLAPVVWGGIKKSLQRK